MDSLDHQDRAKKLSSKIALHFKVLCEIKGMLPNRHKNSEINILNIQFFIMAPQLNKAALKCLIYKIYFNHRSNVHIFVRKYSIVHTYQIPWEGSYNSTILCTTYLHKLIIHGCVTIVGWTKNRECVSFFILGYPTLIHKIFGNFFGEFHRVNPEILGYPGIPRIPL